jgi:hypothetical protein
MSKLGSCALLVLIWSTYDGAFASNAFAEIPSNNMIFTVFILAALFCVWITIAFAVSRVWLSREDTIAVVLGFYKNPCHGCATDYHHVRGSVCRRAITDSTANGHIPGYSDSWQ